MQYSTSPAFSNFNPKRKGLLSLPLKLRKLGAKKSPVTHSHTASQDQSKKSHYKAHTHNPMHRALPPEAGHDDRLFED